MIEINLLGDPAARPANHVMDGAVHSGRLPRLDRYFALVALPWLAAAGVIAWQHISMERQRVGLRLDLESALQDSLRHATLANATDGLRARRDTLARRLQMIHDLVDDRYARAHILDEISHALPRHAWLTGIVEVGDSAREGPTLRIDARTRDPLAPITFVTALKASPYLGAVRLATSAVVKDGDTDVQTFTLELRYSPHPDTSPTAGPVPADGS